MAAAALNRGLILSALDQARIDLATKKRAQGPANSCEVGRSCAQAEPTPTYAP